MRNPFHFNYLTLIYIVPLKLKIEVFYFKLLFNGRV